MALVGVAIVLCLALAASVVVIKPFGAQPADRILVAIDTPYLGQGVVRGTALVMHGVEVGKVTEVNTMPGGGVRIITQLQKGPTAGLTSAMRLDFRPVNYFGVTGISVAKGAGGQALRDGMQITTVPQGNYALQALLSRLGEVSTNAITPQLISVVDRAVQYTDALNPLVETMMVMLGTVAHVQTVPTARLLANGTGLAVTLPPFVDAVAVAGYDFLHLGRRAKDFGTHTPEFWTDTVFETLRLGSTAIFGDAGRLLVKYTDDLLPAVDAIKLLTDPIPVLFRPADIDRMLVELRVRLEKMFAGNAEQRALSVRVVLDSIPGVAAPLAKMGAHP